MCECKNFGLEPLAMVKVTCTAFGDVTFQFKAYHYTYFTYLCWKTSPQRYHVMRLVGETSWQESDQSDNFDRAVEVP